MHNFSPFFLFAMEVVSSSLSISLLTEIHEVICDFFSLKRDLLFFSYPLNKPLNYILSLITMCVPVSLVLN